MPRRYLPVEFTQSLTGLAFCLLALQNVGFEMKRECEAVCWWGKKRERERAPQHCVGWARLQRWKRGLAQVKVPLCMTQQDRKHKTVLPTGPERSRTPTMDTQRGEIQVPETQWTTKQTLIITPSTRGETNEMERLHWRFLEWSGPTLSNLWLNIILWQEEAITSRLPEGLCRPRTPTSGLSASWQTQALTSDDSWWS